MSTRTIGYVALILFALLVPTQAFAAVGRTAGSVDVSQNGEGTYSIPIFAPPGTHGTTPSLALVYGHRNDSTLLGAGWSIAGLSAITRCQKVWAADGEARDVRNDYSDRFCLNGNKLRLVSGTYGSPGATYQTEIETFARITSFGTAGNGPATFVVEAKDGLIYDYGHTADSRVESLGQSTARTWALNRIRDRSGNEINFVYFEDTTNGAYRIDSVQYTSNVGQGLSSAYEIDFVWETKPSNEIDSGYIAGSKVKQITRLDRVDVKYNITTLVRRYELAYEGALSSTSKSRLASVQECAGAAPDCFPPTTFSYQNGTTGLAAEVSMGTSIPATTTPWPMDVNGDGREDLVYSSSSTSGSGTWMVMFANSSGGYNTPVNTGVTNTNYLGAVPIDYNADGLKDLLVPYSGGTWWVMFGSASGLSSPSNTGAPATGTGINARAFDVNGDGLDDLVWADLVGYAGGDAVRYRARELSGAFSSTAITLAGPLPADQRMESGVFGSVGQAGPRLVPDFNGDGRGDFVYRRTTRVLNQETGQYMFFRALVGIAPGASGFSISNPSAAGMPTHGDFNGDGKSDLLYLAQSGGLAAHLSTGAGLTAALPVGGGTSGWVVLDWDSDGYDDVLYDSVGVWQLKRATGEGFATAVSTGLTAGARATVTDLNGDGLYDLASLIGTDWRFRPHAGSYPDLLQTATDAFNNFATFSYASLSNYGLYDKQTGATFPTQEYVGPLYVVSNVAASNGIGGTYNLQSFYYQGARLNLQGRGFLGFAYRSWIDSRDGTAQRRSFRQDFPYIGAVTNARRTQEPSGTAITEVQTTYSTYSYGSGFETRSFPFASQITSYDREAGGAYNGNLIRTTVQQVLVDSGTGTPYDATTTVTEPASANGVQAGASYVQRVYTPTAFFSDTPSTWCRGRPGQVQLINYHNQFGGGSITRTTNITWDTTVCRPTQIVEEPGHAQLQVTRTLGYDGFGNMNSDSVTGIGMTARTTTATWGATGQFPTSVTNALSQTTNNTWNYAFGTPASQTDPNGIAVNWLYDDFGRRTRENRPDGTYTLFEFYTNPICDPRAKYAVIATPHTSGGRPITYHYVFVDQFERPIDEYQWSFSTTDWDTVIRTYDALGRVSTVGAPYSSGGCTSYTPPYVTSFQYDLLSRPTQVSRPTSDSNPAPQTTYSYYEGLTTRVVDPLSKQNTTVANVTGALARTVDHNGYYQNLDYDGFANVVRVMDSLSNILQSNTFNIRGMRTAQTDMDAGGWIFTPNALGEIVSQTDAKSQNTTFGYDLLGRLTSRGEVEGPSTFTFGTPATSTPTNKNVGRLIGMSGPGYSEALAYDNLARLKTRSITSDATYAFDFAYNDQGSLDTLTYPVSTSSYRLKLKYEYQSGQPLRVKDFNAPTTVFWQANGADAWGHVIDETLGNGIRTVRGFDLATGMVDSIQSGPGGGATRQDLTFTWDVVGNLTQRNDVRLSLTESFTYDNLYRLTATTGANPSTIAYNAMGNITSKSGVGSYTYHATKKHAVTAAGTNTYAYDANGNMTSRNGLTTTWYSYNLPNTINGPSSNSSQFFHAPDRTRWKQVASYAGTSEQTIYIGGLVEKVTLGGVTSWKHYIAGGTGAVATYIRRSSGTNEIVYLLKDHLGSVDMITNASGNQLSRLSFDAWGKRRNGGTWNGNPASSAWTTITNTTRRGYTFHEMLDNLNLTHMNGRVYDQVIGRFMSADPFIDGIDNTQGWNRYAYVHNNPLRYTDPSGHVKVIKWIVNTLCRCVTFNFGGDSSNSNSSSGNGGSAADGAGPGGGGSGGAGGGSGAGGGGIRGGGGIGVRAGGGGSSRDGGGNVGRGGGTGRGRGQQENIPPPPVESTVGGDYRSVFLSTVTFSIAQRDLAQIGLITDVEATASIADLLARQGAMTPGDFMTIYGRTLAGSTPANPAEGRTRAPLVERFGQYGFRPEYIEPSYQVHRNNQVRHFVGYVVAGYGWTRTRADLALWYQERYRYDGTEPDYVLGVQGINLGIGIREGRVPLDQVGDWIRRHIGE